MRRPAGSIVIAAHNEEATMARCLSRLLADADPGELDVVVVANACSDGTADIARQFAVRVVETPVAGKANALRLGDAACAAFPRAYLDADIELTTNSVRALLGACGNPGVLACAPHPDWNMDGASRLARRIQRVHDLLVGPHRALSGVGAYVLTEAGHSRAFPLPDVLADDEWVHRAFAPEERVVVPEARSIVRPPRSVPALLRRRNRLRIGNRQLDRLGRPARHRLRPAMLADLIASRAISRADAACYLAVVLFDRALALRHRTQVRWAPDSSSRA